VIELNLGVNHLGRSSENDFQIEHPTVSGMHCEIVLAGEGVLVRDCASSNGTFVGGERIEEASLLTGQTLHLGEVELLVESTEVKVVIPQFDMPRPAPPVVLPDGSLICPRHPHARATHQCTHCREVLCDACVHRLRRHRGKLLKLCPLCSHPCVPLGGEKPKKQSLLELWRKTIKLPFLHGSRKKEEQ
jgi:pSer/pThr/pTyr-binding forkhead associated (FHA) protein